MLLDIRHNRVYNNLSEQATSKGNTAMKVTLKEIVAALNAREMVDADNSVLLHTATVLKGVTLNIQQGGSVSIINGKYYYDNAYTITQAVRKYMSEI